MVAAENFCTLVELAEFHISVAVDAGVRRHAVKVAVNEFVYNGRSEIVGEVENVIGHSEPVRNAARVLDIVKRTAGVCA